MSFLHTCNAEAVTVMTGSCRTETAAVCVDTHEMLLVFVVADTCRTVFVAGVITITCCGRKGDQVYEFAPFAMNVAELPAQTAVGPEIETDGVKISTVTVDAELQPPCEKPITVYTVSAVGVTKTEAEFAPVDQE